MINENDIAWAAGLFDGEGCATIRKRSPVSKRGEKSTYYTAAIQLKMSSKEAVEKFREVIGCGFLFTEARGKYKLLYGCHATALHAQKAIDILLKFSITKRNELLLLKEFCNLEKVNLKGVGKNQVHSELTDKRESYYQQIKQLKK